MIEKPGTGPDRWDRLHRVQVVGLDHVQLAIPPGGEDTARAFYSGLLGLTELEKPQPLAARGGCWFTTGTIQIHLGIEDDFRPARKAHPALVVAGLDELVDLLVAAGHEVRTGDEVDGRVQHFCDDPFGNRIELIAAP